ncbi:acylphosphatase [Motilimonas pumila]|uniref:acylphosphatase n=1 Tax=Motilimonas pumila TaxID=2303987 RepID=A0A418YCR9_9GAMM|nr:acylphosphatase [Motilimonas pumila]RJG42282.1 acylphosphatase [Motilimonas pumila]
MAHIGVEVLVSGVVQGVGFRFFTTREAEKLEITGHVSNLADGDVRVEAYGDPANIKTLLAWLEHGPNSAKVAHLVAKEIPFKQVHAFTVE